MIVSKQVVKKVPCPKCREQGNDNSGDNRNIYEDGSYHCFACLDNCSNVEAATGQVVEKKGDIMQKLIPGIFEAIPSRKLTKQTCEKYNVRIGKQGTAVIYPIYDKVTVVKQKIRSLKDKSVQLQLGDNNCMSFFGQHWMSSSKNIPIIITEGEYDAMSIYQATGYAAVSGVRGSGGLAKEITANLEWLMQWKYVILCFDDDDAGKKAIESCMQLFDPQTVRVVTFPLKDANDMLMAGREDEIKKCLYNAKMFKPATLISPMDIIDKVLVQPKYGTSFPWKPMTAITYGRRDGELYVVAAASGIGKTGFVGEIVDQILAQGEHVTLFSLEEPADDTLRRLAGRRLNARLHLPGCDKWDKEAIRNEMIKVKDNIMLYDSASGDLTLDTVLINIKWTAKCLNTKLVVLDNLKALCVNNVFEGQRIPEKDFMRVVIGQLVKLCVQLNITIFALNHLNKDSVGTSTYIGGSKGGQVETIEEKMKANKLSFEDGRMPTTSSIYGGTNIYDLANYLIVLARNKNSEDDDERRTLRVKFLKCRLDGEQSGKSFNLMYSPETGKLSEQSEFSDII